MKGSVSASRQQERASPPLNQPLFAPLRELLRLCNAPSPDCTMLNRMLMTTSLSPASGGGRLVRFIAEEKSRGGYEQRIYETGEVPTRPDNWHDFFNALVWIRFPRTKAALNALHVTEMARRDAGSGRGALRDAATQFDESGIVVASADPSLLELLVRRRWLELFWERRADVGARMRFVVFGHGLYDALRAPFYRMCGRAALVAVEQRIIDAGEVERCARIDEIIAARFAQRNWYPKPGSLMALPLLGLPGMTKENACAEYYLDRVQFRPLAGAPVHANAW